MTVNTRIRDFVEQTAFIDTHEHIIEESRRLAPPNRTDGRYPCDDWAYLFMHYSASDLTSAGMTGEDFARFYGADRSPVEKWRLFEPYYERAKTTGYLQAVRISVRELYGEENINAESVERITNKMRALAQPGYYRRALRDVANVESCQVNSLEHVFCETEQPDLLMQDMSFVGLSTGLDVNLARRANIEPTTLKDWHAVVDWYFDAFGPRATGIKNQSAYGRRLDYDRVSDADASPLFERFARNDPLNAAELKALQDHLFHYCVSKATDYDLPVKLHTGYYAGANGMPLERVRQNAGDLCPILMAHPRAKFVLMHIGYPYQEEFIALAKQYTNAYVDLCWAWIISPIASVRFVKEALMTAPASKFFAFGGDYITVETVVGHASIARRGITQALSELVAEDWLSEEDACDAAHRIMRGNAVEVCNPERALRAWTQQR